MQATVIARNGLVDALRYVCALGIVWFHSGAPGHQLSYIALPFFLVLLAMPTRGKGLDRAKRLLQPWLVWSAIFGVGEALRAFKLDQALFGWFQPSMVLYGTMIHLWFLPFAFATGYIMIPIRNRPNIALLLPLILAVFVAAAPQNLAPPFPQWIFGIIPAVVGAAFFAQDGNRRYLAFISLFLAFLILQGIHPQPDNIVILAGSALALAAYLIPLKSGPLTELAAKISLPIYLSHPLFLFIGRLLSFDSYKLAIMGILSSTLFAVFQVILLKKTIALWRSRRPHPTEPQKTV